MKKNILLIDDDQVFNFLNTKVLQRLGITDGIHTATNGRDALKLINGMSSDQVVFPDVIFLDINMPIMDGFGFIEAFRKLQVPHDDVVIAIVTSSQDSNDIRRAKELGINHYLTKPISENSLRPVLASAGI